MSEINWELSSNDLPKYFENYLNQKKRDFHCHFSRWPLDKNNLTTQIHVHFAVALCRYLENVRIWNGKNIFQNLKLHVALDQKLFDTFLCNFVILSIFHIFENEILFFALVFWTTLMTFHLIRLLLRSWLLCRILHGYIDLNFGTYKQLKMLITLNLKLLESFWCHFLTWSICIYSQMTIIFPIGIFSKASLTFRGTEMPFPWFLFFRAFFRLGNLSYTFAFWKLKCS